MSLMLAAALGSRKLEIQTLTSGPWVAPAGVTNLDSVTGEGADGTTGGVSTDTYPAMSVGYSSTGSGATNDGNEWSNFQHVAGNAANVINNSNGSGSFQSGSYTKYANGTGDLSVSNVAFSNAIPGTASSYNSGSWETSGPIGPGDGGQSLVTWNYNTAGSAGSDTTGFGRTFPGGAAGVNAVPATYNNVAVSPGTSYPLSIPAGGSITITYYK